MANIVGTNNKDTLTGSNGKDTITALDDDDLLDGRGGNDWLVGGAGHDSLLGGDGKDTLSGGEGNDFLTGGEAADLLDGGAGNDHFLYAAVSDSFANKVDTIVGFESGASHLNGDKIDITALAGSGIAWNEASTVANGAWYQTVAGGVKLMVDVTGDAVADLEVFVQGAVSLRQSDIRGVLNTAPTALNDANAGDAVIESGSSGGDPTASGNVLANDTDADGDAIVVTNPGTLLGTYGSLVLGADGSWTYTLDDARPITGALKEGQSVAEYFAYSVWDGLLTSNATLTIDITGSNDPAVVTGETSGIAVEALSDTYGVNPTGQLYSVDVDGTNNVFQEVFSASSDSGLGYYVVFSGGFWQYAVDNENPIVQGLVDGESLSDSFTAYTQDGTAQPISIEIHGRNDAPQIVTSFFGPAYEDTPYVFGAVSGNPITIVDVDTDELTVTLTAGNGVFALNGIAGLTFIGGGPVSESMTFAGSPDAINAAFEGMTLTVSVPDFTGGPIPFDISVSDGVTSNAVHFDFGAIAVNDAPAGVDRSVTSFDASPFTFSLNDFLLTDLADAAGNWSSPNALAGVLITTLPTAGTLTNGGDPVAQGQVVSLADLSAGNLQFIPGLDADGDAYASFTFQVQDDGGTAYGGIDLDPTPNLMTINVVSANDAPAVSPGVAALDPDFGNGGIVTTLIGNGSNATSVVLQPDGKTVVAGIGLDDSYHEAFALARYNVDGSLDPTFDGDGLVSTLVGPSLPGAASYAYSLAMQADGKIVVVGTHDSALAIARYNADGSLDASFDGDGKIVGVGGAYSFGYSVAVQPDGKILAAGSSDSDFVIVRYNDDGSLDSDFGTAGKTTIDIAAGSFDVAYSMALQSDGKIVLAGSASEYQSYDVALARLNGDGSLDSAFGNGGILTTDLGNADFARSIAIQPDGRIVVAGHSSILDSSTQPKFVLEGTVPGAFAVIRYNEDGSLDTTFDGDGKLTTSFGHGADAALGVVLQADGKIIAAGTSLNGEGYSYDFGLARYNVDGSLDTTFDADGKLTIVRDASYDTGHAIAIAPDGAVIVAGHTSDITVYDAFELARIELANAIPGQVVTENSFFEYAIAPDYFYDPDAGTVLAYSASLGNGDPLPTWLSFDGATRTFSGTPRDGDSGAFEIQVTATDPGGLSASDNFSLTVASANPVVGSGGDDVLLGTSGNDILVGGGGDDTLTGDAGADVFKWSDGDQGTGSVAVDVITDFDPTPSPGTDALDLRDLLVGENAGNLGEYLDFGFPDGNTTIDVNSAGLGGDVDQQIVLTGADLTGLGDESAIISNLLAAGKLITD